MVISITLDQFSRARTVWDELGRNQRRHPPNGIFGSSLMAPIYLQLDEVRSSLDLWVLAKKSCIRQCPSRRTVCAIDKPEKVGKSRQRMTQFSMCSSFSFWNLYIREAFWPLPKTSWWTRMIRANARRWSILLSTYIYARWSLVIVLLVRISPAASKKQCSHHD